MCDKSHINSTYSDDQLRIISLTSRATWLQDLNITFKLKCTKLNSSYILIFAADNYG